MQRCSTTGNIEARVVSARLQTLANGKLLIFRHAQGKLQIDIPE
jgi:hypothetical protein